jgi:hypothetical protein
MNTGAPLTDRKRFEVSVNGIEVKKQCPGNRYGFPGRMMPYTFCDAHAARLISSFAPGSSPCPAAWAENPREEGSSCFFTVLKKSQRQQLVSFCA